MEECLIYKTFIVNVTGAKVYCIPVTDLNLSLGLTADAIIYTISISNLDGFYEIMDSLSRRLTGSRIVMRLDFAALQFVDKCLKSENDRNRFEQIIERDYGNNNS